MYSFQRWPDIVKSFGRSGSYTPSWSAARRQAIADDVQAELVDAAIIHRIDPSMGSTEEIIDSLWVRARLVARNNSPLIRTVAGRLNRYGSYTGEEIQRILDESMKELDR